MSLRHAIVILPSLLVSLLLTSSVIAATDGRLAACTTPVYHQFDFWLGDWDTFDTGKPDEPSQARNHVTSILDGCVLLEHYVQTDGLIGESFTLYDATRKVWHQTWVTNRDGLLVIEGGMQGKRLMMHGTEYEPDGHPVQVRAAWWPVTGGVRETADKSSDGGKTWYSWFDITFRPHHAGR